MDYFIISNVIPKRKRNPSPSPGELKEDDITDTQNINLRNRFHKCAAKTISEACTLWYVVISGG